MTAATSNLYYKILELDPGASKEDIKKAYRQLAKVYHPDVNNSSAANEKFIAIQEAYDFLIHEDESYVKVGNDPAYQPVSGSFDSFLYRTQSNTQTRNRKKEEEELTLIVRLRNGFFWFAHVMFFIIGLSVSIIPIRNAIVIGPDDDINPATYYFGTGIVTIFGVILSIAILASFKINFKKSK